MTRRRTLPDSLVIACMADTHRLHRSVFQVPDADVLIHAGDILHNGESRQTLIDFNLWLGELPHALKVCVPGNHDAPLDEDPSTRALLSNATLLVDQGIEFRGLRIWGTPATGLSGGAFSMWYPPDRRRLFSRIPSNTDVLISHVPPHGTLDCAVGAAYHAGDPELRDALRRLNVLLHVFGHVHAGHGVEVTERTVYVNATMLGESGGIEWEPIVVKMPRRR